MTFPYLLTSGTTILGPLMQHFQCQNQNRRRGYGGVAIIWHKELQNQIKILDEGNERIIAVECKTEQQPICLICTYMPTSGYHGYS